ncbi:MAG: inorganic diphosphatase [Bacteroidota bacterium]|nr:inorganic diphosphatase [Bacteroidota bacterium]
MIKVLAEQAFFVFAMATILAGCISMEEKPDFEDLATFSKDPIMNAVIEIPAGASDKFEYDPITQEFPVSQRNGVPRRIKFLPYPANYGFIPSTKMNKDEGGDGDAVDVFVLCGALPTGTVIEVEAIGIIELLDAGERDDKLVAIPIDPELRTVDATDITELPQAAREILVTWLLNYDPEDGAELVSVKGRNEAIETVKRWQLDR